MKVYRILTALAVCVAASLFIVYGRFQEANSAREPAESSGEVIRVLAPYQVRVHQRILEEIAAEYSRYEENPDILFEFIPEENMKKELCLRKLNDSEQTDLIICSNALMPELIEMGLLRELDITEELKNRVRKQQMWESTRSNGRYYGVPFTLDPYIVFYNSNRVEGVPDTWDELIAYAGSIQKSGFKTLGAAMRRKDEAADLYRILLSSMGGNYHSIDSDAGLKAFELLGYMSRYGMLSRDMMNYTREDLATEFSEGLVSFMINRMSMAGILRTSQVSFEVGMSPIPEDVAGGTFLFGENIGVIASGKSQAWDFIKYMLEPSVYERIADAMDVLPVFADVRYQEDRRIRMENTAELLEEIRGLEPYSAWTGISEIVADGVYRAVGNDVADLKEVAEEVHDKVRVAIMSE